MKNIKVSRGFTLIEVLVAITLASSVMGMIIYMVTSSMEFRKKAVNLNKAIFLAEKTMNEIKNKPDLPDNSGDFPDYPGFSFSYSMIEIEYDPLSGVVETAKDSAAAVKEQYRAGQTTEISSGQIFRMNQYNVSIFYNDKILYNLESLRGLKVEQTAQ